MNNPFKVTYLLLFLGILPISAEPASKDHDFILVEQGSTDAVIVVDADQQGCPHDAAKQLAAYIRRMSGVSLPIKRVSSKDKETIKKLLTQKLVLLGNSALTRKLGIDSHDIGTDGYRIRVTPKVLAIIGRDNNKVDWSQTSCPVESGTWHGVFALLRELGVRTFFDKEELDVIPRLTTISVPSGDQKNAPYFPFRWAGKGHKSWGYKVGFGGTHDPWPSRHSFGRPQWFSDAYPIVVDGKHVPMNWDKRYMKTHPEWFITDRSGKRRPFIRFNAPGVKEQIIKDASAWYALGQDYYTLIQNDGNIRDTGSYARENIDPSLGYFGYASPLVINPLVDVAHAIEIQHPDKKVTLGAYHNYSRPPRDLHSLPRNTAIMVNRHRLANVIDYCERDNKMLLNEWLALNPAELYLWEYYCYNMVRVNRGNRYTLIPRFLPNTIANDVKWLAETRKKHPNFNGEWLFLEWRRDGMNKWWFFPNAYITARLFWDPTQPVDKLTYDFYAKAFGPAKDQMQAFYELCEKTWTTGFPRQLANNPAPATGNEQIEAAKALGHHFQEMHFTRSDFEQIWDKEVMNQLSAHLEKASQLAKESDCQARVEFVRRGFECFKKGGYAFDSDTLTLTIDEGVVTGIIDKTSDKSYAFQSTAYDISPLVILGIKGQTGLCKPLGMHFDQKRKIIRLTYPGANNAELKLAVMEKPSHIEFEVISLNAKGCEVEFIQWGGFNLTSNMQRIPNNKHAASDGKFMLGILPLDPSTTTGRMPRSGIKRNATWDHGFTLSGKHRYLSAYSKPRSSPKGPSFIGAKIACYGCTPSGFKQLINRIDSSRQDP
ncbi:DUF4838 domain-containing protein [Verrucomicrobiaceae bacterium N1E253]|uniref:DUF4838 domain-containing protein n=1 Tax=Oceaniferula marina TaxID=2748318 RepID=A0A851GQ07_9BACT|nr:DUF4838 domain-containing protein [Oceaniferula marina]NWK56234.1 DUF4838 domain-containing protein [Oceaniferula marina]